MRRVCGTGKLCFVFIYAVMLANIIVAQPQNNLVSIKLDKNTIELKQTDEFKIELTAVIEDGFHINSNKPNDDFLIPVEVTSGSDLFLIDKISYPEPEELKLAVSSEAVSAYEGVIKIGITLKAAKDIAAGKYDVPIVFSYQACDDKNCFPPASVTEKLKVNLISNSSAAGSEKETDLNSTVSNEDIKEVAREKEADGKTASAESKGIILALLFAFIGGLILNLMPCVLPVLSLKIMGIVEQAGEAQKEKVKHGLLFTFGVLVSFWVLAGLLMILRAGGEQLGWGFQLQSPGFVIVVSIFIFLFGLSMFGVFEIGVTLTSVGQKQSSKSAYMGSFTSGVLATVVATPCTAPFMGSALGFAISQPYYVSLLVFTFLGLGMAAPYLVLTTTPKLLRFIPKPGTWMETMKQFMGFLLMATVLWLLWVLGLQTGANGVVIVLASLILASVGGWVYGRWGNIAKTKRTRRIAQAVSCLTIIAALMFSLQNVELKAEDSMTSYKQGSIEWKKFSPQLVEQLRSENKPVFIDFTAGWCLSCQVNEKVAFGSDEVQNAFTDKKVVALKADWTNKDETITRALAKFGRNSVPFYVLYTPGDSEPVVLPEILTPDIVVDKLSKID